MTRKWLWIAFLLTMALTVIASSHQLTNAAPDMAPPPQHAPAIGPTPTPSWHVISGGGGIDGYFTSVSMGSPADGWAVGISGPSSYGIAMHYDGSTWHRTTIITTPITLGDVEMTGVNDGWIIGNIPCAACDVEHTALFHLTPSGWQTVTLPAYPGGGPWPTWFNDIDIRGSYGWAVGTGGSYFLKFTSPSTWTPVAGPSSGVSAVSVLGDQDAWGVGTSRYAQHYTGGSWSDVSLGLNSLPGNFTARMQAIDMVTASDGWAVGFATYSSLANECLLLHYTGVAWARVACPTNNLRLYGIRMRSATDGWISARTWPANTPVMLHYNGSAWSTVSVPSIGGIALVGTDDGWIVGAQGVVLRLMNGAWTQVQGPTQHFGPIDAASPTEVWSGGLDGQLTQWQNGMLTVHTSPVTTEISTLDMVSPTLGWAGTFPYQRPYSLLRYSDGVWTTWPMSQGIEAISMIGPDEGWFATGYDVLHYKSGVFEAQSLPNGSYVQSISMLDADHGWGIRDTSVMSYTSGTWAIVTPTLTTGNWFLKIVGISPDEAWVAGTQVDCVLSDCPSLPELHHFINGAWTNEPVSGWLAFFDISKVSATEWWATGKLTDLSYAFLHYDNGNYTIVPAAGEDVKAVSMLPDGTGFAAGVGSLLWLHSYPYNVYLPLTRR